MRIESVGAYCIECQEEVEKSEDDECLECGEESVPLVSWRFVRDAIPLINEAK